MGDDIRGDAVQVERDGDAGVGIDSEHRHDEWRIVRCWGGKGELAMVGWQRYVKLVSHSRRGG